MLVKPVLSEPAVRLENLKRHLLYCDVQVSWDIAYDTTRLAYRVIPKYNANAQQVIQQLKNLGYEVTPMDSDPFDLKAVYIEPTAKTAQHYKQLVEVLAQVDTVILSVEYTEMQPETYAGICVNLYAKGQLKPGPFFVANFPQRRNRKNAQQFFEIDMAAVCKWLSNAHKMSQNIALMNDVQCASSFTDYMLQANIMGAFMGS